ncbi:DNA cytosine methyltransferase [Sulfuracidifex tepidarius]|uniref:DNA (cytosine-5-)-methyltransferase n=1 Tax=Sulfuracidifex tepidarius TaxID=1294262 RepID=A0A510DW34_9CREN|nr:DNA cytosine methyltransferase [Sulfuracidifex tepidarius]BBG24442.1 Modification methylase MthTI [Sulfuracidifex tepidarius]BBG27200.1 Modification methylase MthTI [Sulfuracidifex tepidarius]
MVLKIVDLFSGAGGFAEGFRLSSGFEIKLAVEINSSASKTYSLNFPDAVVLQEDIRDISASDIRYLIGGNPDVVIGSPPCEPFTAANPMRMTNPLDRLYEDQQGSLTLEFIRLVEGLSPKIFVMENVQAIIGTPSLKEAILNEFMKAGFKDVYLNLLEADKLGSPSRRSRVFISNIPIKPKLSRKVTVWEAIGDLENRHDVPNHEIQELDEKKLKEISKLDFDDYMTMFRGSNGRSIPTKIRLNPYEPAPTVMGNSRFVHPFLNRFLTVREQARLMTYPDNHVFVGSRDDQYNQVGEAVPVVLSSLIAQEVLGALNG